MRISLREDKQIAWARQGNDSHLRTNPDAVIVSAISGDGEHIDLS